MTTRKGYASVDGKITALDDATIPVTDRGFLYGDSVYEVFRTYDGVPFLGIEYWRRLQRSAALIKLRISESMQDLHDEIARTIAAWHQNGGSGDAYARYAYTRGGGPIDIYPAPDLTLVRIVIVQAAPEWPAHHYKEGVTLAIPSIRRNPIAATQSSSRHAQTQHGSNHVAGLQLAVIKAMRNHASLKHAILPQWDSDIANAAAQCGPRPMWYSD